MAEQLWIVAIRLKGNARYAVHGLFGTRALALQWLGETRLSEPDPPVQWRIIPVLSPNHDTVVWRNIHSVES
jgi:hypothetical protein